MFWLFTYSNIAFSLLQTLATLVLIKSSPWLLSALGGIHGMFWLFSVVAFAMMALAYFLMPETKGLTLYAIQKKLNGSSV